MVELVEIENAVPDLFDSNFKSLQGGPYHPRKNLPWYSSCPVHHLWSLNPDCLETLEFTRHGGSTDSLKPTAASEITQFLTLLSLPHQWTYLKFQWPKHRSH